MAGVRLDIPKRDIEVFKSLGELDGEVAESLLTAIANAKALESVDAFVEAVSAASGLDEATTRRFVSVLTAAYSTLIYAREPGADPSEHIMADIERKIDDADLVARIKERLARSLGFHETLGIVAKARSLQHAFREHYLQSRFISDLRPVFSEGTQRKVIAAVITHELELRVHGAEYQELHIGFTKRNLEQLRAQIDDALAKQRELEDHFGDTIQLVGE